MPLNNPTSIPHNLDWISSFQRPLPESDLKPTDIRQHDFINSTQNMDISQRCHSPTIPMRMTTQNVKWRCCKWCCLSDQVVTALLHHMQKPFRGTSGPPLKKGQTFFLRPITPLIRSSWHECDMRPPFCGLRSTKTACAQSRLLELQTWT